MNKKQKSVLIYPITLTMLLAAVLSTVACRTSKQVHVPTVQSPPKPVEKEPTPAPKPKEEIVKPLNFGLLLPLDIKKNLDAITDTSVDMGMDNFTMSQLQFAEGALLAVDSLNAVKQTVNIKINDAPADSFYLSNKLYKADLLHADVIIAAVPAANAPVVQRIANMHKQKVIFTQPVSVSSLPSSDRIYLAATSTPTQCEMAASKLAAYIPSAHYFLLTTDNKRDLDIASLFKPGLPTARTFVLTDRNKLDSIAKQASRHEQAIIIVSSDEDYVSSTLNKLNAAADGMITVLGLPTWENFETIDFSNLKNIRALYFTTNFIDEGSEVVKDFRNKFISKYNTDPMFSAYQGYELIMEFAANRLDEGRKQMRKKVLPMKFMQNDNHGCFENRYVRFIEIKNFELIPVD
ncbi:MAG: hypothetical protein JSS90_08185 [Bacteroidetes bacterium]|nr:hypothetical protein [Bacteroidota bacterium]